MNKGPAPIEIVQEELYAAAEAFGLSSEGVEWNSIGNGLIHQTYRSTFPGKENQKEWVLQLLNHHVFPFPEKIMFNIELVARHLAQNQYPKIILNPLKTSTGSTLFKRDRLVWRAFPYIPNSMTIERATSADTAYNIAYTFGEYLYHLDGLDSNHLKVTNPGFHNTSARYERLKQVVEFATDLRLNNALKSLQKAEEYDHLLNYYHPLSAHLRVTHGDTKINNVLLDEQSKLPICVIDLDTLMPGMVGYDYGDMVRTIASTADENHSELSEVTIKTEYVEALYDGFLTSFKNAITSDERESLTYSCALIIWEQAIRFLTDYLENDRYYAITYEEQNLVRGQNQLILLEEYLKMSG